MSTIRILNIILFLLPFSCFSQKDLSFFFEPDSTRKEGIGYTLSYTSRRSLINSNAVSVRGVHGGIRFGKNRNRLTAAYFWCNTDPSIRLLNFSQDRKQLIDLSSFMNKDFHYYNVMYYPYWLNSTRWRLSTPVELGVGRMTSKNVSVFKEISTFTKDNYFIPFQAGAYIEYKAMRHLGVNFELGYRFILKEQNMNIPLEGVYYGLGLNIYAGTIWRDFLIEKR